MSKFAKKRLRNEMFPWLKGFYGKYVQSFLGNTNDAVEYLFLHVDNEVKSIEQIDKLLEPEKELESENRKIDRAKELFQILNTLFPHFWWKVRWHSSKEWKKYWKKMKLSENSTRFTERKYCVKILYYMLRCMIFWSKGDINSVAVDRIVGVLKLLPDTTDIPYRALLLLNDLKKKYRPVYVRILKYLLCRNIKDVLDPFVYCCIILLYRRLLKFTTDEVQKEKIKHFSLKLQPPINIMEWLLSLNVSVEDQLKVEDLTQQLLSRSYPDEFLRNLHEVVSKEERLEEKNVQAMDCEEKYAKSIQFCNSLEENSQESSFAILHMEDSDESQLMEEIESKSKLNMSTENSLFFTESNVNEYLTEKFTDYTLSPESKKRANESDSNNKSSHKKRKLSEDAENDETPSYSAKKKKHSKKSKHKKEKSDANYINAISNLRNKASDEGEILASDNEKQDINNNKKKGKSSKEDGIQNCNSSKKRKKHSKKSEKHKKEKSVTNCVNMISKLGNRASHEDQTLASDNEKQNVSKGNKKEKSSKEGGTQNCDSTKKKKKHSKSKKRKKEKSVKNDYNTNSNSENKASHGDEIMTSDSEKLNNSNKKGQSYDKEGTQNCNSVKKRKKHSKKSKKHKKEKFIKNNDFDVDSNLENKASHEDEIITSDSEKQNILNKSNKKEKSSEEDESQNCAINTKRKKNSIKYKKGKSVKNVDFHTNANQDTKATLSEEDKIVALDSKKDIPRSSNKKKKSCDDNEEDETRNCQAKSKCSKKRKKELVENYDYESNTYLDTNKVLSQEDKIVTPHSEKQNIFKKSNKKKKFSEEDEIQSDKINKKNKKHPRKSKKRKEKSVKSSDFCDDEIMTAVNKKQISNLSLENCESENFHIVSLYKKKTEEKQGADTVESELKNSTAIKKHKKKKKHLKESKNLSKEKVNVSCQDLNKDTQIFVIENEENITLDNKVENSDDFQVKDVSTCDNFDILTEKKHNYVSVNPEVDISTIMGRNKKRKHSQEKNITNWYFDINSEIEMNSEEQQNAESKITVTDEVNKVDDILKHRKKKLKNHDNSNKNYKNSNNLKIVAYDEKLVKSQDENNMNASKFDSISKSSLKNEPKHRMKKLFNLDTYCNTDTQKTKKPSTNSPNPSQSSNLLLIGVENNSATSGRINNSNNLNFEIERCKLSPNSNTNGKIDFVEFPSQSSNTEFRKTLMPSDVSISELLKLPKGNNHCRNKALSLEMNKQSASDKDIKKFSNSKVSINSTVKVKVSQITKINKKVSPSQSDESSFADNELLKASKKILEQSQMSEPYSSPSLFDDEANFAELDNSTSSSYKLETQHSKPIMMFNREHSVSLLKSSINESDSLIVNKQCVSEIPSASYGNSPATGTQQLFIPAECNAELVTETNSKYIDSPKSNLEKYLPNSQMSAEYLPHVILGGIQKCSSKTSSIDVNWGSSVSTSLQSENTEISNSGVNHTNSVFDSDLSPPECRLELDTKTNCEHLDSPRSNLEKCLPNSQMSSNVILEDIRKCSSRTSSIDVNWESSNSGSLLENTENSYSEVNSTDFPIEPDHSLHVMLENNRKSSFKSIRKHFQASDPTLDDDLQSNCKMQTLEPPHTSNIKINEHQDYILESLIKADRQFETKSSQNHIYLNAQNDSSCTNSSEMQISEVSLQTASTGNQHQYTSKVLSFDGRQSSFSQSNITTSEMPLSTRSHENVSPYTNDTENYDFHKNVDTLTEFNNAYNHVVECKVNDNNNVSNHSNARSISAYNCVVECKVNDNNSNVNNLSNARSISSVQVIINLNSNLSNVNTTQMIADFDFQSVASSFQPPTQSNMFVSRDVNPPSGLVHFQDTLCNASAFSNLPSIKTSPCNETCNVLPEVMNPSSNDIHYVAATEGSQQCPYTNPDISSTKPQPHSPSLLDNEVLKQINSQGVSFNNSLSNSHSNIFEDLEVINSKICETDFNSQMCDDGNFSPEIKPLSKENVALVNRELTSSPTINSVFKRSSSHTDIYSDLSSDDLSTSTLSLLSIEAELTVGKTVEIKTSPSDNEGRGSEVTKKKYQAKPPKSKLKSIKSSTPKKPARRKSIKSSTPKKPARRKSSKAYTSKIGQRKKSTKIKTSDINASRNIMNSVTTCITTNNIENTIESLPRTIKRYNLRSRTLLQQPKNLEAHVLKLQSTPPQKKTATPKKQPYDVT